MASRFFLYMMIALFFYSCDDDVTCKNVKDSFRSQVSSLKSRNDTVKLINKINTLIEKNARCSFAYQVRGWLSILNRDFKRAKSDFEKVLYFGDTSVYVLYSLSSIYYYNSLNDSALYFINKAIDKKRWGDYVLSSNLINNDIVDIAVEELVLQRGIVEAEMGFWERAKMDFKTVFRMDGEGSGEAAAFLSTIYYKNKDFDSVCFFYKQSYDRGYKDIIDSAVMKYCK